MDGASSNPCTLILNEEKLVGTEKGHQMKDTLPLYL